MDQIVNYLLFAQSMTLLIFSMLQLIIKKRSRVNNIMTFLFFLLGYLSFYFWSYRTNVIFSFPVLLHSDLAVTFLIGPIAYAYIKCLTGEKVQLSYKNIPRYLPATVVFCFFIVYNVTGIPPTGNGGRLYPDYHSDPLVYAISILADICFFIYAFLLTKKIYVVMRTKKFRQVKEICVIFYIFSGVIISTFFLFPAHIFKNDILIGVVTITNGILSVIYFLFSYRHPEYTQVIIKEPKDRRGNASLLNNIDVHGITGRLTIMMEKENIYRNPEITLQSLSNSLAVSSYQLSLILNEKLGLNFRAFINRYRLDEAKKLLSENHDKTVLEIAFYTGFNSKTAFNTIFIKETGLTPTAYRKKNS